MEQLKGQRHKKSVVCFGKCRLAKINENEVRVRDMQEMGLERKTGPGHPGPLVS